MSKIIPSLLCATALFGCRTSPVTPEQSWSDYRQYYSPTSASAIPFGGTADVRVVPSEKMASTVGGLTTADNVVIGSFKISDGTDITEAAVRALAAKLNASTVVWSTKTTLSRNPALPNPDMGIDGVDKVQAVYLGAKNRADAFSDPTVRVHEVYMLGKKK